MLAVIPEIPTDLLTPLGAYLRVRAGATGAFLLESVERGRLGRHSFVGRGSRLVGFDEAEALGEPVVGYLGYDVVTRLEPTVRLPTEGPGFAESCFVVPERGIGAVLAVPGGVLVRPLVGRYRHTVAQVRERTLF